MPAPYSERWERTKRYLLRNFLVNPGFQLSPIPEEDRSSPDGESLPDLIVEPEPNRHDHAPDFYDALERRMRRYYRQLFLGEDESEDSSSDFEVNRSMSSTFINTRKDVTRNDINIDSDQDVSITNENQPIIENEDDLQEKDTSELITCASSHTSIDDLNKSSTVEDSQTIESSTESDPNENTEVIIYESSDDITKIRREESETIENKSVEDDSTEQCHRISTTVAQIHGSPARASVQFDSGSPVLIPRVLQFRRTVFGSGFASRLSGQSVNVLNTSGQNIDRVPTKTAEESNIQDITIVEPDTEVQKLLTDSELTRISIDKTFITAVNTGTDHNQEDVLEKRENINTEDDFQENERDEDNESNQDEAEITDIGNESIEWNKDGVDDDEDGFDFAIRKGEFARKARHLVFRTSDSFENLEPIAHTTDTGTDHNQEDVLEKRENINTEDDFQENERDEDNESNQDEAEITDIGNESIEWNKDGVDDDEDGFDFAIRKGEFARKARDLVFRTSDSFENLEPIAHTTENFDNEEFEPVEEMREAQGSGANESWHGGADQTSPALAFETKTSAERLEECSDTEISASTEDETVEDNIQNLNYARVDDFWSVSSVEVDLDNSNDNSSKKRRSDSSDDLPLRKRKKDMTTQTGLEEKLQWESVRKDLFVGLPLVLRLCRCQDHVCS
ncbi:protein PFC0760c-like isoform X1 [Leguminivora glycinivorella]|uniref:protein PFC0760c-like isoform X1 n=1 Tax=Leguminivora glycinivorella TaxID=1035111 RepID=UPI00200FB570|nr:protein PFC0760c-like isoform X1 [Leguminivora glycinivorella]